MKRLLLAYGNTLRGDDGAAWELARRAAKLPWERLCVIQLTPELADTLKDFDEVVFADATHEPGPLGWQLLQGEEDQEWSTHVAEPRHLLGLCQSLYGKVPKAWILTIPGEDFGYRLGLSEFSQAGVAQGLKLLKALP